jgi:excinuclease ABC subunit C
MQKALSQKIKELPLKPGVYIFKDAKGAVLYVGKAVKLRQRVSSYFKKEADSRGPRIASMVSQIADLDYAVTDNEVESLVLENNFIKSLRPKYNVRLRDDKNYLFIKLNLQDEIPTITYEHRMDDSRARYFGPYTSSQSIKDTLRMIRKVFPYCANSKVSGKPCFYYHIQKCPGVCIGKVSLKDYRQDTIAKIIRFLEGKQTEVLKDLQGQMKFLAAHKEYEKAARVRDQIFALNRVMERQKLVYANNVDQDVFGVYLDAVASINLFIIRRGKLIQKENFVVENTRQASEQEVLQDFLPRYYAAASNLPKEIMTAVKIEGDETTGAIKNRSGKSVRFSVPTRGNKAKLMHLARENAKQYLEAQSDKHLLEEAKLMSALKELQRVLGLKDLPGRMECFDISNIQGTNAVGSNVVFEFGRPAKNQYRKFKIKTKSTPDDFAMMREMLERRFKRSVKFEVGSGKKNQSSDSASDTSPAPLPPPHFPWPLPDLIIIDGGKGQLSTAQTAMKDAGLNIPMIGLAKRLEEIFLPGRPTPILLPPNSIALFLLQRIRDEAHRFAITYHRKLRSRGAVRSVLDDVAGVGEAKKKKLLQKFGSAQKIREASLTDIAAIVGGKLAEKIKASI